MKWLTAGLFRLVMRLPGADRVLRDYLIKNDGAGLGTILNDADTEVLRAISAANATILERLLSLDEAAATLAAALVADKGKQLKGVLASDKKEELKQLLLADEFALFRELALAQDGAPLKQILFDDDYHVLRQLLSLRGYEALKATVFDGPADIFPMLATARKGVPLADVLFADEAKVLRGLCSRQGLDALFPLFQSEMKRFLLSLPDTEVHRLDSCLTPNDGEESDPQAQNHLRSLQTSERWRACKALSETWQTLAPLLPKDNPEIASRFEAGLRSIREPAHVRGRILDAITEEDIVHLAHGSLRFPCRHSLWTLLHEILLHEDYFFSCDVEAPRIIDGGTHMGMAIYYFKTLYPEARIIGFEPLPYLKEIAAENVARNEYTDVTLLPYALAESAGTTEFYASESWSMAGSLHNRRTLLGDAVKQIAVECVPLSDYLDEPVHFLKLDIEGSEAEVLAEAAEKLPNVQHLFCEFHQGSGLGSDRLATILAILETADFEVQVGKSHNYQQTSRRRPFTHFDGAASLTIWARNRNWGHV